MSINVKSAQHVQDYILDIDFDTGESRRVDFAPYIAKGKIFSPLQDITEFKNFYIDTTVMWKSGADVAPEILYNDGVVVK